MTFEETPPDPQPGFVMTFAMHSPIAGGGARPLGQFRLPFLPRQGDLFALPDGSSGVVQQVRFELSPEQGFGILVILGHPRGQG